MISTRQQSHTTRVGIFAIPSVKVYKTSGKYIRVMMKRQLTEVFFLLNPS